MSDYVMAEATNAYAGHGQHVTTQLGAYVARERLARGMTQADLALASGVSASLVAQIEQGRRTRPTKDTLRKLARGLDMRLLDFLVGAGEIDREDVESSPGRPALERLYSRMRRLSDDDLDTIDVFVTALQSRSSR